MDGSGRLSESERQDLLARIDRLLGDTPKGRMVREIVVALPGEDDAGGPDADQSGKAPSP